jgi:hypothetical protein
MNQQKKLNELEELSYFDKNTLSQFIDIQDNSLYANLKRWLKQNKLIQLKKGWYVTQRYYDKLAAKEGYLEFVANKLKVPSYLSLEYILQKYSVLTESVFAITSVSLKTKRIYENKLGLFSYRHVCDRLFTGYQAREKDGFQINEATKPKALFDYLYLKLYRVKRIDKQLIDSYRLNLDQFTNREKKEFSQYCRLAGLNKYMLLPKIVFSRL